MPGSGRTKKLALLTVPQAFGLDELHGQLQSMYRESFSDPAHWRALMAPSGLPAPQAADHYVPPGTTEQGPNDTAPGAVGRY